MLESAKRLKALYLKLYDIRKSADNNLKKKFPNVIFPDENVGHIDGWFLARNMPSLTPTALDAFFSIYGLIVENKPSDDAGDWYIKFEEDKDVENVLDAMSKNRLVIGDSRIKCYRLSQPPI